MSDSLFSADAESQLMTLRGLTKNTGVLHEAQVLQVKAWPIVLFSNCKSSKFSFCWEKREVEYDIKTKGRGKKDEMDRGVLLLDHYTKTLLGPEYTVTIFFNGVQKYVGMRKIVAPPAPDPKYDVKGFENSVWRRNFEKAFSGIAKGVPDGDDAGTVCPSKK